MANELDETKSEISEQGRDVNVINKQLLVTVGAEATYFSIGVWAIPLVIMIIVGFIVMVQNGFLALLICIAIGCIPGVAFEYKKVSAANYLLQLQQKIQHDASQIDNYLEQRVVILKNAAKLLEKGIALDQNTFSDIAKLRSGNIVNDNDRNELAKNIDEASRKINVAFENYPNLKAHNEIEDVLQQNSYLQREITAAREVYNDAVLTWNREIYEWPVNKIVAAKKGYTTRIPFIASSTIKEEARDVFF